MRPVKLVMQAFGPFSRELEIDFRNLASKNFFLIHGPTGAGKTTILDAMCFALYGVTSGQDREARQMRSDHADPRTMTEVTFDFSLGRDLFRVTRRPEQERPKKRGQGTVTEKPAATLWLRTNATGEQDEGKVLAGRPTRVSEEIERRLGFKSEQFRQVIMLPQGRFRELLLAGSGERQAILERLFHTEIYRRIEDALKNAARETEDAIANARERQKMILSQAQAESGADISARRKQTKEKRDTLKKRLAELRKAEKEAQSRLNRAEQDLEKINEKDEAEKAVLALKKQEPEFRGKGRCLDRARRAVPLIASENALFRRREETTAAENNLFQAEKEAAGAEKAKDKAAKALDMEQGHENELSNARRRAAELDSLVPKVQAVDGFRQALDQAKQEADRWISARDQARKSLDQVLKDLAQTNKTLEETTRAANRLEVLRLENNELKKAAGQRHNLEEVKDKAIAAEKEHQAAMEKTAQAKDALGKARKKLSAAEEAWREGQAAVLAQGLTPGEPCPVCGSADHPFPCAAEEKVPGEASLKKKRSRVSGLEDDLEAGREAESRARERLARLLSEVRALEKNLGQWAGRDLESLKKEAAQKAGALAKAEAAHNRLSSLEQEADRLKKTESKSRDGLAEAEAALNKAETEKVKAETKLKSGEAEIPAQWRTPEALSKARTQANQTVKTFEEAMEIARKNDQAAGEALAGGKAALKAAQAGASEAKTRLDLEEKAFAQAVKDAGFQDKSDYQKAKLSEDARRGLERGIKQFEGDLQAARQRSERAEATAKDIVSPDLPSVKKTAQLAKEDLEKALKEEATLSEQGKQIDKWLGQFNQEAKALVPLRATYGLVGRLAAVADGKNDKNLTFQRFVL
ncbi:MAG: SMC family ATPase, partial [Thermodesulfobacteriota bacterium]|nr:SMC family ATPase [Thermodesulfobacteriota bacterium]